MTVQRDQSQTVLTAQYVCMMVCLWGGCSGLGAAVRLRGKRARCRQIHADTHIALIPLLRARQSQLLNKVSPQFVPAVLTAVEAGMLFGSGRLEHKDSRDDVELLLLQI